MNYIWLYIITVLIWGSSWFAITFQIGVVDEVVSVFFRFLLAAVLLLVFCVVTQRQLRFSLRDHWFMFMQGLCLFCLNYVLIYYATAYISSGLVAVAFSILVILNIFNAAIFLKRPIRPMVLLGAVVGLVGIALVFSHELIAAKQTMNTKTILMGLLLVLVAAYSASLGNIISARNQSVGIPVVQANAFGTLYGSVILFVYGLVVGAQYNIDWTWPFAASLLYLCVFGTIIAFGAYLSLVGKIGADKAAYAMVLFPIVALLISTVFEGFEWSPLAVLGVALVIIGNVVVVGWRQITQAFKQPDAKAM